MENWTAWATDPWSNRMPDGYYAGERQPLFLHFDPMASRFRGTADQFLSRLLQLLTLA